MPGVLSRAIGTRLATLPALAAMARSAYLICKRDQAISLSASEDQKMAKTRRTARAYARTSGAIHSTAPIAFAGVGAALAAGLGVAAAGLSVAFWCAMGGAIGGAILGTWLDRR